MLVTGKIGADVFGLGRGPIDWTPTVSAAVMLGRHRMTTLSMGPRVGGPLATTRCSQRAKTSSSDLRASSIAAQDSQLAVRRAGQSGPAWLSKSSCKSAHARPLRSTWYGQVTLDSPHSELLGLDRSLLGSVRTELVVWVAQLQLTGGNSKG